MLNIGRKITTKVNRNLAISIGIADSRWTKSHAYKSDVVRISDLYSICGEITELGTPELRVRSNASANDLITSSSLWTRTTEQILPDNLCGRRLATRWNDSEILILDKLALQKVESDLPFDDSEDGDTFISEICEFDGAVFDRYLGKAAETFRGLTPDQFLLKSWETVHEKGIGRLASF